MQRLARLFGRRSRQSIVYFLAALVLAACAAKTVTVAVPPKQVLTGYPAVGVIDFVALQPGPIGADATRKFVANLHGAQPGVRILELGSQERILREVGCGELDFRAVRAIGEKYGVPVVITGTVELSAPRTDLSVGDNLTSLTAKAKVDGRMSAKLWETASGASLWSNSSWGNWTVGGVSVLGNGTVSGGYQAPEEKRDQILMALVEALNGNFWPTYEKRRVEE